MTLKLSNDRKVSPLSRQSKSGEWKPLSPNSFGLPAGKSCPGETPFCKGCYAASIEKRWKNGPGKLVQHNYDALLECGSNVSRMVDLLADMMVRFLDAHTKVSETLPVFRIHWDGDFYSKPYTVAWSQIIRRFRGIQFWAYTRSFEFVPYLDNPANLALYLSVDEFNVDDATEVLIANPWVRLAFCADTWEATEDIASRFPQERKGPRCPALTGKLPLVNDEGVGACVACGLCIYGKNNVRFAVRH